MASIFKRGGKGKRGNWLINYVDHTGKSRTISSRTTDKATAERIAAKLEADEALRRSGVVDPLMEAFAGHAKRPIAEHVQAYKAKLQAAGRAEAHVTDTMPAIRRIVDESGWRLLADVRPDAVNVYAGKLRDENRSARTVQKHLTAIKSFTRWLMETGKLPRDPLASVKKPNPKSDRRHERRMLFPEEWTWLRSVTLNDSAERYGMAAAERVLLYATAIQTGLRSSELRSLTRGRLYLDGPQPFITCKAGSTKNKKEARQYIHADLAAELAAHVAGKAPRTPVFGMPHVTDVARMLRGRNGSRPRRMIQASTPGRKNPISWLTKTTKGNAWTSTPCATRAGPGWR